MNKYLLEQLIEPYLDMADDTELLLVAYWALIRICKHNGYEKDENGNVIHPCNPRCPVDHVFSCTELENLRQAVISRLKAEKEIEE